MGEILSEDVLDWARDLAAIQKLLAGQPLDQPTGEGAVLTPQFGAARARRSDPAHSAGITP
jgi:hypothetical protein